ncbi:MAG: nicotinate phosphoribosyltransferase [Sandaracinaceae bacterium]|nr:nicotinate phosphoribosyltransferase [Sandaracinaceae bacterium]
MRPALGLLTDLYQVTMAYAHHRAGTADDVASFSLFFRRPPFGGSYAVAAGIDEALSMLEDLAFDASDVDYLGSLTGADGLPLFDASFLERLRTFRFRCDVEAVAEGEIVYPHEPLLRVTGPVLDAQLAETLLLNVVNFQTLVATKAARVVHAAAGRAIVEFGLRRGQGPDGALSASRASYLGGAAATSNVLAGKLFGIPVRGTHAHAWVQFFGDEREAFARYADALAGNVVFLVDTYDTIEGVAHAIETARVLATPTPAREAKRLLGIRLDSGDLAALARRARTMLDEAGLTATKIYASNDLDEHAIATLVAEGAPIDVFGVGTRLVTGGDQSALGGVYKLSAVRDHAGRFEPRIKKSEDPAKVSWPGRLELERFVEAREGACDVLFDLDDEAGFEGDLLDAMTGAPLAHDPAITRGQGRRLLTPALAEGRRVRAERPLAEAREAVTSAIAALDPGLRALDAQKRGARARVAVPRSLWERRDRLVRAASQPKELR